MSIQKNEEDENLTVSKMYETLQSPTFLNRLYWDVLSNIKDKPTFIELRGKLDRIVKDKIDAIEKLPDSNSDFQRKSIIAEICSMTYTIDTLFSKLLYLKLDKMFKGEILNIMKELKEEGNLPEEISSRIQIPSNSNSSSSLENSNAKEVVQPKASKAITKKSESEQNTLKKLVADSNLLWSKIAESKNEDSDAESDISVGHLSIASVSSVHTSDLSSFDDEISLSSEDEEGPKKKLSLKYLQQICENGTPKLDKISNSDKPKKLQKEIKENVAKENNVEENTAILKTPTKKTKLKIDIQDSAVKAIPSTPEVVSDESTSPLIPKRVRKPNSRYSSDSIVCHSVKVKERKKQPIASPESTNDKDSNSENSPMKKRLRSENEAETPNKLQKLDTAKGDKNLANQKSASKETKSSDLNKPVASVRPLTSRRTAPKTLYSTL